MSILTASPVSKNNFRSAILAGASLLFGFPAAAATLNPGDYTSLGLLGGSAIALDSSALTVDGSAGGVLVSQGGGLPDIAVFTFDGGSILGDVTVSGQIPIAILFRGSATITGQIDIGGTGRIGVGGGADGGLGGTSAADGDGPGAGMGGSTSASTSGIGSGSGGGFGTDGEHGGAGPTFRAGGAAYGDPLSAALQGGSGGGGGWGNIRRGGAGGAGGGALEIGALTRLFFDGASIMANGADGASDFAGGGGGSGGGLLVHAFDIDIAGNVLMTANGGAGGNFGAIGNQGGCGGAGRIQMLHNTAGSFSNLGTIQATSGTGSVFCDRTVSSFTVTPDGTIGTPPGAQVPVPATLASLGSGLALLGFIGWRRRRTA